MGRNLVGPPVPGVRVLAAPEPRRVDGAAGVGRNGGVGIAALAESARLGDIDHHGEKPSAQRGSALEVGDPLDQRDPGVLNHFFGDLATGHIAARHAQHGRGVLVDQLSERRFIAPAQRGDQRCFVHYRPHHWEYPVTGTRILP